MIAQYIQRALRTVKYWTGQLFPQVGRGWFIFHPLSITTLLIAICLLICTSCTTLEKHAEGLHLEIDSKEGIKTLYKCPKCDSENIRRWGDGTKECLDCGYEWGMIDD